MNQRNCLSILFGGKFTKLFLATFILISVLSVGLSQPAESSSAPEMAGTYIPGKGRFFDGSDYLDLSSPIDMSGPTTVELWVRLDGDVDNHSRVGVILGTFGNNNNDAIINYELHEDGKPRLYWNNGDIDLIGNTPLRDGKWHHVAFTHEVIEEDDGNFVNQIYHHVKIYVDGSVDATDVVSANRYSLEDPQFSVGGDYRPSGVPYFNGFMDELRLWNKVLSVSEIQSLAAANVPANTTNLIHYFPMDEEAVGITDAVGNLTGNQPAGSANDPEFMHFTRTVTEIGDQMFEKNIRCLVNHCTLRAAVAEDIPRNEKVLFSPTLAGNILPLNFGEIAVDNVVSIDGINAPGVTIDAQENSRIFKVTAPDAGMKFLTLLGGKAAPGQWGGAIHIEENVNFNLFFSTLQANEAALGGAIASEGTLLIKSSTITGNTATNGSGGALYQRGGIARVEFSTVAFNTATNSPVDGVRADSGGTIILSASILKHDRQSCSQANSTITSGGYNIVSDGSNNTNCNLDVTASGTDQKADPLLGSLADNGGRTKTFPIAYNSPAVDHVPSGMVSCGSSSHLHDVDQRGQSRPTDGDNDGTSRCDVGAFEFDPGTFTSCDSGDMFGMPVSECEALVALYDSTAGESWSINTNWKLTNSPCEWHGVTCANEHVTTVDLSDNNLTGQLPASLNHLTLVTLLEFGRNELSGSLPNLSGLNELHSLGVFNNSFSGPIPASYGSLTSLSLLQVSSNQLTGSIPAELGNSLKLAHLFVNNNLLMGGVIPPTFNGKVMKSLVISGTQICEPAGFDSSNIDNFTGGLACPTVKMSKADVTVAENGGNAELAVQLSVTSALPITLTYSTGNGIFLPGPSLATAGSDYTAATNKTLVIPAGQSSATLSIPILDDGTDEQNEHFVVELSLADNLAGATLVSLQNVTTVQITDNDEPGSTNSVPTANGQSVTTGQGQAKAITLTGSDPDSGDTLSYTIVSQPSNGTLSGAAPNVTYTPNAGFVGNDSFTFKVNDGLADSAVETVSIVVTAGPGNPTETPAQIYLPIVTR